jgi:DNA-directed RNA polymerase alpha subunit
MEKVKMPEVRNIKTTHDGRDLTAELVEFPVGFVNAIRRILLSGIPTVVIRDVQILENTTQMPHEMLRHRMEMLPVNVTPDESAIIKEAKIELRMPVIKESKIVTTDDFTVESGREGVLMKDPEFGTPCLFLKVRPGEKIHMTGRLALETDGVSQVETASTCWHIDPNMAKDQRKQYIADHPDDKDAARYFDNFLVQRCYSRDEKNRPNWFDLSIKSIGVLKARHLLKMAVQILKKRVDEYMALAVKNIRHEKDEGSFSIPLDIGGHTLGVLLQEVIYQDDVQFVSYDILHPLKPQMVLHIIAKKAPEKILETAKKTIDEYCSLIENNDGGKSGI